MTRINVGIPPHELSRQHLLAEHREMKRIPNCIVSGKFNLKGQPAEFKLGAGHVKFFYTRLGYLKKRYESVYEECINCGYNVTYYGGAWAGVPEELMGDYSPTQHDRMLLLARIAERLSIHSREDK
jgi:deoxyribonuclease (pyrimidine dimer)